MPLKPAKIWDVERGIERASFSSPGRSVHSLAYSPDGTALAAADMESILLRDPATGAHRATLVGKNFRNGSMGIGFSPDGKTLVSMNHLFRIWRPVNGLPPRPAQ